MVIQVEIQNKPDLLRTCRWRWRGEDGDWTHGYFHIFYVRKDADLAVMLETENGLIHTYSPPTALEIQFTDRGRRGCSCGCDCATPPEPPKVKTLNLGAD